MEIRCPIDRSVLQPEIYEADVQVEVRPSCRGMWLDKGELEAIQEIQDRDYSEELSRMADLGYAAYELARQKSGRILQCPRCQREMEAREYARCSQVLIDVCPGCHGVWLDEGELKSLEVFFERSQLEASSLRRRFFSSLRMMIPH